MKLWLKILSVIGSTFYCAMLVIFIVLYFPMFILVFIFVSPFDKKRVGMYYVSKGYCFGIMRLYPFLKIEVKGMEKIDQSQPYIMASNHQSMLDIPLLGNSIPLICRFISKKEAYKIPFAGWVIWLRGDITIERGGAKSAKKMMLRSKNLVGRGISITVFPEGTRTKTGRVGRFKEGAFLVAKINSAPILPIAIEGTWEATNYLGKFFKIPTTFKVTVLDPISKEKVDSMKLKELTAYTHSVILDAHREMVPHLYVEKK